MSYATPLFALSSTLEIIRGIDATVIRQWAPPCAQVPLHRLVSLFTLRRKRPIEYGIGEMSNGRRLVLYHCPLYSFPINESFIISRKLTSKRSLRDASSSTNIARPEPPSSNIAHSEPQSMIIINRLFPLIFEKLVDRIVRNIEFSVRRKILQNLQAVRALVVLIRLLYISCDC